MGKHASRLFTNTMEGLRVHFQGEKKRKQSPTIACSILLSMATTLAPEELEDREKDLRLVSPDDVTLAVHCG